MLVRKSCEIMRLKGIITLGLILLLALSVVGPSSAESSAPGSPDLDAIIYGGNELIPGEATQLNVLIQNTGLIESFDVYSATIANLSVTAIDLSAELKEKNDIPITIKTDKVLIGALPSMYPYPPVSFSIEVDRDAQTGTYEMPLVLKYKKITGLTITGGGTGANYYYTDVKETIYLEVKIVDHFDLIVDDVKTTNMYGGSNGDLELTIKNNGQDTAYDAVLTITPTTPAKSSSSSQASSSSMDLSMLSSLSSMSSLAALSASSASSGSESTPFTPTTSTFVGDIKPGEEVKVNFEIGISSDAITKKYPVKIVADYYDKNDQPKQSTTAIFGILISEKSEFLVRDVQVSGMDAGGEGTITLTIENAGDEIAYSGVASLNLKSPFSILDNTAFIGDLKPRESTRTEFKVQIAEDASNKEYPLDLKVSYEDKNREKKEYTTATFGVPVEAKMDFEITEVDSDLEVGSGGVVEVTFKNIGSEVAKDAIARISATTPLSSTDDTAFLGTLEPGESSVGKFRINVDGDALAKGYSLNTEIKYTSEEGNTVISDVMKLALEVKPRTVNTGGAALFVILIIVLIVLVMYYLKKR